MTRWFPLTALATLALTAVPDATAADAFPVTIRVDAARTTGELRPIWRFFGADEPNYAYLKDGQKLLAELGELRPKSVYFRTHNLLTSGDGTPRSEEHTSELQSLRHLVCRLLLEKKNTHTQTSQVIQD